MFYWGLTNFHAKSQSQHPKNLSDYCVSVTLSFSVTASPIRPSLAERILIYHSSALSRNKFKLDRTTFELIWEIHVK
jgi:hypothetical protein